MENGAWNMDEQSYLEKIQACERSLYRVSRSILWNDTDCADAVQQAVFKGWLNRNQLQDQEKFKPWIMSILVNECRNLQRKNLRHANVVQALTDKVRVTGQGRVQNPDLQDAIKALPEHYRLPIVLHYIEGYPIKEIAGILNVNEKRVTERMYRARRKLEEALSV